MKPLDPPRTIAEKLKKAGIKVNFSLVHDMAKEISDMIDREILKDLLAMTDTPKQ